MSSRHTYESLDQHRCVSGAVSQLLAAGLLLATIGCVAAQTGSATVNAPARREIDFRDVNLLNLEGCTDPRAANYKSYFVTSDNSQCRYRRSRVISQENK